MKKLKITKKQFNESNYFQKKYGTLKYVSESGNVYKTSKGKILKFKESNGSFADESTLDMAEEIFTALRRANKNRWNLGFSQSRAEVTIEDIHTNDCFTIKVVKDKQFESTKKFGMKFNESQNDVTIDDFKRMYGKNAAEALNKYCVIKNKDAESVINGSDSDMARFENWAKKVLHVDIYDKFSGYDYDSDLDDSRSEIDESSNDDMDKEFSYKGITITRYDYESLPYPMAASQVDDRTMMNIAKEIYNLFIDNGWSDMDVQKYGADIDEIADDNPEMDMFHDEWWTYMEKAAIKYGMPYYEDMDDESTNKVGNKFNESIDSDPAYVCPYCGNRDCEFEDAENYPNEGYFDGTTFNAQFWCNRCNKPYNVTYELKVKDVYPNEDADSLDYDV